jgi:hypothetical protein
VLKTEREKRTMAQVEYRAYAFGSIKIIPDSDSVPFVAKIHKAKTRKNKNYYVLRATLPKEVAEKVGAKEGDYLFFRAKKAQWYHMLDWEAMDNTWKLLPDDFKNRIIMDGLHFQRIPNLQYSLGATNVAPSLEQALNMQRNQIGESPWK